MRRSMLALALAAVAALGAAACSSSAAPGWTYAPPTLAAPVRRCVRVAPARPPRRAAPRAARAAARPPASVSAGTTVQLSAANIAFEQTAITAPADTAFTIHFDNKDARCRTTSRSRTDRRTSVFKGDLVTGPATVDYQVAALAAGAYPSCAPIHPNMTGTLTVGC